MEKRIVATIDIKYLGNIYYQKKKKKFLYLISGINFPIYFNYHWHIEHIDSLCVNLKNLAILQWIKKTIYVYVYKRKKK